MTDREELFDDRVGLGLRELDGHETPPDVRNAVLDRLAADDDPTDNDPADGAPKGSPLSRRALIAALLAGAVTTALMIEGSEDETDPSEIDNKTPGARPASAGETQGPEPAAGASNPQDPQPVENPDDGSEYVEVREIVDIINTPPTTTKIKGHDLDADALAVLAERFPDLRMLWLEDTTVDNALLQALAGIESVIGMRIAGRFDATPRAYRSLSELPRLQHLGLEDELEPKGRDQQLDDACLREIRAGRFVALAVRARVDGSFLQSLGKTQKLRHLLLAGCIGLEPDHLRHVPASVRDLDLRQTGLTGLAGHCRHLRACGVRCNNGLRIEFPAEPDGEPVCGTSTIRLTKRNDNGPYGTSAFSFRYDSGDVAEHQNQVDLVFNRCGNLHINAIGGMKSRAIELGRFELRTRPRRQGLPTAPPDMWHDDSIRPVVGTSYLEVIQSGDRKFAVMFRVTELTAGTVKLEWRPLDEFQEWPRVRTGRAGTMGSCGGAHAPR
ncbi:MAG: hypothetical protein NXI31_25415 [bacterium]|nr:hypothetical protein [bacterium]